MFFCANFWIFIVSLLLHWWFLEGILIDNWDFDADVVGLLKLYCANLPNNDVSLLLHSKNVDESLKNFWWDIDFQIRTPTKRCFFKVVVPKTPVSLLRLRWFADDCLKKHCWNSEDFDANINDDLYFWGANLRKKNVFITASLLILWWFFDEALMNNGDFDANNFE